MGIEIEKAIAEAQSFFKQQAVQNNYGEITVTITLNDGVPVKLTKVFCEQFCWIEILAVQKVLTRSTFCAG